MFAIWERSAVNRRVYVKVGWPCDENCCGSVEYVVIWGTV